MDSNNNIGGVVTPTTTIIVLNDNKNIYSLPPSPTSSSTDPINSVQQTTSSTYYSPISGVVPARPTTTTTSSTDNSINSTPNSLLSTPKKNLLDAVMLRTIREKLRTPGGASELQLEYCTEPMTVVKDRYLIVTQPSTSVRDIQANVGNSNLYSGRSSISYRRFIDLASSNLKCTDVYTEEEFQCKVINEPFHKVQMAYMRLKNDDEFNKSAIYRHSLIRGIHDIVPLSSHRTYVIIKAQPSHEELLTGCTGEIPAWADCDDEIGVYEDLHTYVRQNRGLDETKSRYLFHQICQTVMLCHRNGIILRDLKLKRFYFINKARTKLQYESLEGCMILDNLDNDILSEKVGCPLYTAPELLCPNPTYHGKPADMWSLGVILYTMTMGQYPFYEKGNHTLITIIRHSNVHIPSFVPNPVRTLIHNLLRKSHEERLPASELMYSKWLRECKPAYTQIPYNFITDVEQEEEDYDVPELQGRLTSTYTESDSEQDSIEDECGDDDDNDEFDDENCEKLILKYAKATTTERKQQSLDHNSYTLHENMEYEEDDGVERQEDSDDDDVEMF